MNSAKKLAKSKEVMTSAQNLIKSKTESGSFDTGHMGDFATHSMNALNQSAGKRKTKISSLKARPNTTVIPLCKT